MACASSELPTAEFGEIINWARIYSINLSLLLGTMYPHA